MEYDQLLKAYLGEIGRYQMWIIFWLSWVWIWGAFNNMGIVFLAAVPDHWCATPELDNLTLTQDVYKNISIPYDVEKSEYLSCEKYNMSFGRMTKADIEGTTFANRSGVARVGCSSWQYDQTLYKSSVVSEWDLVCDNEWMIATVQSMYMVGLLIGVVVFGQLADVIGRRPVIIVTGIGMIAASIGQAFSVNYPMFLAMRVTLAMFSMGCYTCAFVYAVEIVGPNWRTFVGILCQYIWGVGYLLLAGITYAIRDWKTLALALGCPQIINLIFIFVLSESARWLYVMGKKEKGDSVVHKMAKWNKVTLPDPLKVEVQDKKSQATVIDLLRTPNMRLKSLIQFFLWFVTSMVYYGLSLNSSNLGGDPYINFLISAGVEIPAYALFHFLLVKIGRRICTSFTFIAGGIALLCILPVPEEQTIVIIVLSMTGKFMISASFAIVYLYSAELFPTEVRTVGVGCSSMFARVGGILAPYIGLLPSLARDVEFIKYVPTIIFGAFSLAAGLLAILLPETMDQNLPETLLEGELIKANFCWRKSEDKKSEANMATKMEESGKDNPAFDRI
ncbi:unnamed protein product [Owenia fusiformis]|uniref:Uncharacterized protein n=1 Tax=Owenia fusiformis TaxID=6347 RepID=A0A8J1TDJ2_OWEFU|nr:unnamed protein product [Owenia fusiformis]